MMNDKKCESEEERRAANGGFLHHEDSPWAIFEGNYRGKIKWSDLGAKKIASTEEDVVSRQSRVMMQNKVGSEAITRLPPTPWNKKATFQGAK